MINSMIEVLQNKLSEKRSSPAVHKMVRAKAPASSANLGPGFDVFGLALNLFHDEVEIEIVPNSNLSVTVEGVDHERISTELQKNTAGLVASVVMDALEKEEGLKIRLIKGIPVGGGLGSSAASAAACIRALDEMFCLALSSEDLVGLAAHGEIASAGTAHYDNVAAAVLGGFVIVSREPLRLANLKPPSDLEVAVAIPSVKLPEEKTKRMREILPRTVDLDRVAHNVANACLFVAGMALSDIKMIGAVMSDSIAEPVRSKAVPMYDSVRIAAFDAGASGFTISGAGPTVIAVCNAAEVNTRDVAYAMKEAFEKGGFSCDAHSAKPSGGATVIEKR